MAGIEAFELGSTAFIQEVARRALSNSELGHVVISDRTEGAKFSGVLGEHESSDWGTGNYLGVKTFAMRPGDEFGFMLIPNGKVQQVFNNPNIGGAKSPVFSMATANRHGTIQFAQIVDVEADGNSFVFEDISLNRGSDRDYNDLIFQVQGAMGKADLLNDVINPATDWRNSDLGQELMIYTASNENGPLSNMGSNLAQVFVEYETYLRNGGVPSSFEPTNFLLQVQDGQIVIDAVASDDPNTLFADLTALGLQQGAAFESVVSGLLPIEAINEVAVLNSLVFASPAYQPITKVGITDSQGDRAMNANFARTNFNVNGAGVTVGVISDSYNRLNGAANDVATNDLPGVNNTNGFTVPINVLEDGLRNDTDEGRAMLQLIHDVAPGANLAFHTGNFGAANFAQGIIDLADAGANVIVDDLIYHHEPFFQDGIIAQAVDRVFNRGVSYFSSAGNLRDNSYESAFRSSGQEIHGAIAHDFDPGAGVDTLQRITIPRDQNRDQKFAISLQWDSPFLSASPSSGGATSDLNIYLLDNTGTRVLARSDNRNIGRDAVEVLSFTNNTAQTDFNIAITNPRGVAPNRLKYIIFSDGATINEWATNSSTVVGHAAAIGAMAVGAAYYRTTPALEGFSSVGPTTILFDRFGTRLATPEIRQKPEIVAPDGTNTTFFPIGPNRDSDQDGFPNFFGTSAAAPHAAAVAALMLEAVPGTPPDILYRALRESALDMGIPGVDNMTGNGFIQADGAIQRLRQIQLRPEINLQIPNLTVTPPHTFGDREFDGHGPRMRIQSQAVIQGTTLQVVGNTLFEETRRDFTTFSGSFSSDIVDINTIFPGFVIDAVLSGGGLDTLETTDVDLHDRQTIVQDSDDLVARYEIQGDTRQTLGSGSDKPFVSIAFNPVRVRLRSATGELVEDTFLLPDITRFQPPRVGGDDEFDGHGPRIQIQTDVIADGTILRPYVNAIFEETRSDFTTFAGILDGGSIDVSQRYPGFVIDAILSDNQDILETIDVSLHSDQEISLDSNELVRKYNIRGDRGGNDQPSVDLSFNPVRVRLRPV